jgi:hypothetical protein
MTTRQAINAALPDIPGYFWAISYSRRSKAYTLELWKNKRPNHPWFNLFQRFVDAHDVGYKESGVDLYQVRSWARFMVDKHVNSTPPPGHELLGTYPLKDSK